MAQMKGKEEEGGPGTVDSRWDEEATADDTSKIHIVIVSPEAPQGLGPALGRPTLEGRDLSAP